MERIAAIILSERHQLPILDEVQIHNPESGRVARGVAGEWHLPHRSVEWDTFRGLRILHGVYEAAFKEFPLRAEIEWPNSINHPVVALFLLVCDMAINPGSGFPFDPFPGFQSFIDDTIPGIRFTAIAQTIRREPPELLGAINGYTHDEFEDLSE
jgi:hypothetical protein